MKPIPISGYPLERTYDTADAAIHGAMNHPLQPKARSNAALLLETSLVDGFWTNYAFALRFSNGIWLHVFMENHRVRWSVVETEPCLGDAVERVGSPAILLDWGKTGQTLMDRSTLITKRRGRQFHNLFVNECGFLVYLKDSSILWFRPAYRTDTGEDMLYVTEDM